MSTAPDFEPLLALIEKLPAIDLPAGRQSIGFGTFENGNWWIKLSLDTKHDLAWRHVQELGFVLNYVSIDERLPTDFIPVSPPPYMNGDVEFLSWVVESTDPAFTPANCAEWLEARLPNPVTDPAEWNMDEERDPANKTVDPSDNGLSCSVLEHGPLQALRWVTYNVRCEFWIPTKDLTTLRYIYESQNHSNTGI